MKEQAEAIRDLVLAATQQARLETSGYPWPELAGQVDWPLQCIVGPGLEGAIACESSVGYVNGTRGMLVYRGYDIFDLCAYSSFEEVTYLLLHGSLPGPTELASFRATLAGYRYLPRTLRRLMGFPVETMKPMASLRLGTNLSHQEFTLTDQQTQALDPSDFIGTDEDSIAMETAPAGRDHAVYEFKRPGLSPAEEAERETADPTGLHACYHLIAGLSTITAAIGRLRAGLMPIDPDPELGHAANFLYMLTGRRPTPSQERIMDICLILHADHGMNASTFAALVVASTQADMYFSVGAGISALSGPLHGGANELALQVLKEIGHPDSVGDWYQAARETRPRIPGFGHRVYKTYDPRARVLAPLAGHMAENSEEIALLFSTATALEQTVISDLGAQKRVFPNVDFYSGLVYSGLNIPSTLFTPCFAMSRVAGWTARVQEYLENNRIFRPRAVYTGPLNLGYVPLAERKTGGEQPGQVAD